MNSWSIAVILLKRLLKVYMNKKIKFAVVGFGYIAQKRILPAIINHPKCDLSVIIDRTLRRSQLAKKEYNVPLLNSIDNALKMYDVDVVYISTPTGSHYENILSCLKFNKHILCEKSLVTSFEETLNIVNLSKQKSLLLFEGFMYQFHNGIIQLKKIVEDGLIGRINFIHSSFGLPSIEKNNYRLKKEMGGGVILDAACYTLHSSRLLSKQEPNLINSKIIYNKDGIDVSGSSQVIFKNNIHALLTYSFNSFYKNNITIHGDEGIASLDRVFTSTPELENKIYLQSNKTNTKEIKINPCDHFFLQIDYFINSLNNSAIKNKLYDEIINQSKALNRIKC